MRRHEALYGMPIFFVIDAVAMKRNRQHWIGSRSALFSGMLALHEDVGRWPPHSRDLFSALSQRDDDHVLSYPRSD